VATGGSGGSTESGVSKFGVDLSGAYEFLKLQYTLTTSSTGTVETATVIVLGGYPEEPV
jgi:hypothetical protein